MKIRVSELHPTLCNILITLKPFSAIHHVWTQSCSAADMYLLPLEFLFSSDYAKGVLFSEPCWASRAWKWGPCPPRPAREEMGRKDNAMLCGKGGFSVQLHILQCLPHRSVR